MITVAFVGCAHIHTSGFVKTINSREDVRCKSVWDHDTARAEKRAEELNAQVVADFADIYADPEIDAVIICTETNRHAEVVLPGAAAKKHLFVEKPLGVTGEDGWQMAAAIEKSGVIYGTGLFTRGDAKYIFLKQQVEAGVFGKITRVRGSNCHSGALGHWFDTDWRWMADPKQSGVGGFGDLGAHTLDILIWLLGDVAEVTAQVDEGTGIYPGCDETGEGLLRFSSGVIGTLAAAWDDLADPMTFMVSGTEGFAAIINHELYFKSEQVEGADGKTPWTNLPPAVPAGLDAFLEAVGGGPTDTLVTVREAAYRGAVMAALYEGAEKNTWVTPKRG